MIFVLAPWVMLAPLLLLLRRALWVQATALPEITSTDVAPRVSISLVVIDHACGLASRAIASSDLAAAARLLHGAQAGTVVLVRDIRRDLSAWAAATWVLDDAVELPPLSTALPQARGALVLACMERWLRAALPGNLARLRVRLFMLSLAWCVLQWELRSVRVPKVPQAWPDLATVQADLHALANATLEAHAVLVASLRAWVSLWRLAT